MSNPLLIHFLVASLLGGISFGGTVIPDMIQTSQESPVAQEQVAMVQPEPEYRVAKTIRMVVTAYSSTEDQTDDTPFITASGKTVAEGIIANNLLPFGTKVRIPELGPQIYTVQDRMNKRKGNYHVDIWMSEYKDAKAFGAELLDIEVLES